MDKKRAMTWARVGPLKIVQSHLLGIGNHVMPLRQNTRPSD